MNKSSQLLVALLFIFFLLASASLAVSTVSAKVTGSISGKVTDEMDEAVDGALVEAFTCEEETLVGAAFSNSQGEYLFKSIADGCYLLRFHREGYESSWHGAPQIKMRAIQIIVAGKQILGIDVPLSSAGAVISGQVKDENGQPLSGAWVTAFRSDENGYSISDARTDKKGVFFIDVYPSSYGMIFGGRGYVSTIYGGDLRDPLKVDAVEGEIITVVDAVLAVGGQIRGQVTDDRGQGLEGIDVAVQIERRVALDAGAEGAKSDSRLAAQLRGAAGQFFDRGTKHLIALHAQVPG